MKRNNRPTVVIFVLAVFILGMLNGALIAEHAAAFDRCDRGAP